MIFATSGFVIVDKQGDPQYVAEYSLELRPAAWPGQVQIFSSADEAQSHIGWYGVSKLVEYSVVPATLKLSLNS